MQEQTTLHHAVALLDVELVKRFLSEGADPNEYWRERTPLMIACGANTLYEDRPLEIPRKKTLSKQIVELLLDAGADPDLAAPNWPVKGWTALHFAVQFYPPIPRLLARSGATVTKCSALDGTPIDIAKKVGRFKLAKYLEKKGAN